MLQELDTVVLTNDQPEHRLAQGDIGVVVHVYRDGAAFEVECTTAEGTTVALLTLTEHEVRPMRAREILHMRELTTV